MPASIPTATYRFQFHRDFKFRDALALVPYLHDLGISHVYASPIFRATPGSLHGYDICDHNALNPEVGTREEFDALIAALHEKGMGFVVDFVPNHMGIAEPQNEWWMDVLESGPASPFAKFFDIDWVPLKRELENKVLLPILGDQYGRVLEGGHFKVKLEDGRFRLYVYEQCLPFTPRSTRRILRPASERLAEPPIELESILTALEHLPSRTDTDPEKIAERRREKEVIRHRLAKLCAEEPAVLGAIEEELKFLNEASDQTSYDRLDELINDQAYRLSSWKTAAEEINYRRFFDVNSLAAIRMELPEVFEATHRLLLELIANGSIDGVRIDHIDGLANPREYLTTLQAKAGEALGSQDQQAIYLLVEKILGLGEHLRRDWPVHGTTGYEYASQLTAVLLDKSAERAITDCYHRFVPGQLAFAKIVYRSKHLVMQVSLASEVNSLGHLLNLISEGNRWYRDFTVNALTSAVRELIACFPVYRTYLVPGEAPAESDVKVINRALARARRRNPAMEPSVFEFLRDVLLPPDPNPHPVDEELRRQFVLKFQQCTGPITAKGVEDTSFYVYNRFVALNEVGGEPGEFGESIEHFHQQNLTRLTEFPHCMLASSTHDTKRSEDVRARLVSISEFPKEWTQAVRRWHTANRKFLTTIDGEAAPDPNEEILIYQTLLGSWPLEALDENTRPAYQERIQAYLLKALREAKVNTSWIQPNEPWEKAVQEFVAKILAPGSGNRFLATFEPFVERLAALGAVNSLSQTVLKLTCPGVPDLYQGTEIWDFSLVDPDNRRPVDYPSRQEWLASLAGESSLESLVTNWQDGRIKMFVIRTLLHYRRKNPELFAQGSYAPVAVSGALADCVIAFERTHGGKKVLVVVPRHPGRVGSPPLGEAWQNTAVTPSTSTEWTNLLTWQKHTVEEPLRLAEMLAEFPVAVLAAGNQ